MREHQMICWWEGTLVLVHVQIQMSTQCHWIEWKGNTGNSSIRSVLMSDLTIVRIPSVCKSWSLLQSRTAGRSRSKRKLEVVEDMESIGKAKFGGTPDFLLCSWFNDWRFVKNTESDDGWRENDGGVRWWWRQNLRRQVFNGGGKQRLRNSCRKCMVAGALRLFMGLVFCVVIVYSVYVHTSYPKSLKPTSMKIGSTVVSNDWRQGH